MRLELWLPNQQQIDTMRTKTQQELIDIIRFEICGTPLPDDFSVSDEEALVGIAQKHDLSHLVYDALEKNGIKCSSSFAMKQYYASIWRAEQMTHELERMSKLFEHEGIDFIPLKGAVMRPLYPEPWMRTSADIDILFREQDAERALDLVVEKLNYEREENDTSPHHMSAYAPTSKVHIELHKKLFEEYHIGPEVRALEPEIWQYAFPETGCKHLLRMTDACFYFYHSAHMAKHLSLAGGCSIRGLIDLWFLNGLPERDEKRRKEMLESSGLLTFAEKMSALAKAWLEGGSVPSEELEQFVLSGSMYGTTESSIASGISGSSIVSFVLNRVFLPYDILKHSYPILKKHKILTPVFQIVRWTNIFRKDYRRRLKHQTDAFIHMDQDELDQITEVNRILGIENIQETPNALV